ncbi:MAG: hypothetical protein OEW12_00775 [Deltaproteobacteria bacterium]|nr:hypothetical protein [Deltaproteobacteria bacterium]
MGHSHPTPHPQAVEGRPGLPPAHRMRLSAAIVLDRLAANPGGFKAGDSSPSAEILAPVWEYLKSQNLALEADGVYQLTPKGQTAHQQISRMRESYLTHFDIFALVNLEEGMFGSLEDVSQEGELDEDWVDLRVAVAEFKGVDPYTLVFCAMLSDPDFFAGDEWMEDLPADSFFYQELEAIVQSQLAAWELGIEPATDEKEESGEENMTGEEVLEFVIGQGAQINRERAADLPEGGTPPLVPPGEALLKYINDPKYVEPLWKEPWW